MTKEEFIGIAADALMRANGLPREELSPSSVNRYMADATAALEAVGAFELYEACRVARTWPEEDEFGNALDEAFATPGYRAYRALLRDAIAKAEQRS